MARTRTLQLAREPQRAFRGPGALWSLDIRYANADPPTELWLHCYDARATDSPDEGAVFLICRVAAGADQGMVFPQGHGLHLAQGLIMALSAEQFSLAPPPDAPHGFTVTVTYTPDAEISVREALQTILGRRPGDPHSVTASLPDFLRTGALGPIRLGFSRQEVHLALGNPDDWQNVTEPGQLPDIYKYGDIEFHFDRDRLWLLHSDSFDTLHGGAAIQFDPWIARRGTPLTEALGQLTAHDIAHRRIEWPHEEDVTVIETDAGVQLHFAADADPDSTDTEVIGLQVITYTTPPMK